MQLAKPDPMFQPSLTPCFPMDPMFPNGELLPYAQDRARASLRLSDPRRSPLEPIRIHGGVLQPPATAFDLELRSPAGIRSDVPLIKLSTIRG